MEKSLTKPILVIGDYQLSSWSMRPWLALKAVGVSFETKVIKLQKPGTRGEILALSPSGKVPALIHSDLTICESLAICEYVAELAIDRELWPRDKKLRALARSASSEMHSGFTSLRTQMSFGLNTRDRIDVLSQETAWDIDRIFAIWRKLLQVSGSKTFLCGSFGIVDAMFAPVHFRFRRFGVNIPQDLRPYTGALLSFGPVQEWLRLAETESNF
jgi:glutathione S-transferase